MATFSQLTTPSKRSLKAMNVSARRSDKDKKVYFNFSVRNIDNNTATELQLTKEVKNFNSTRNGAFTFGVEANNLPVLGLELNDGVVKLFKEANEEIKARDAKKARLAKEPDLPF